MGRQVVKLHTRPMLVPQLATVLCTPPENMVAMAVLVVASLQTSDVPILLNRVVVKEVCVKKCNFKPPKNHKCKIEYSKDWFLVFCSLKCGPN